MHRGIINLWYQPLILLTATGSDSWTVNCAPNQLPLAQPHARHTYKKVWNSKVTRNSSFPESSQALEYRQKPKRGPIMWHWGEWMDLSHTLKLRWVRSIGGTMTSNAQLRIYDPVEMPLQQTAPECEEVLWLSLINKVTNTATNSTWNSHLLVVMLGKEVWIINCKLLKVYKLCL